MVFQIRTLSLTNNSGNQSTSVTFITSPPDNILITCFLTSIVGVEQNGMANMYISEFVNDGQKNNPTLQNQRFETGYTSVTTTLATFNVALASGVAMIQRCPD
jgi:hypothetical protein